VTRYCSQPQAHAFALDTERRVPNDPDEEFHGMPPFFAKRPVPLDRVARGEP